MRIARRCHFYAAHRNELLKGSKCENIHGHRYGLEVDFDVERAGAVTVEFSDLDKLLAPIVGTLDHSFLVHCRDPLLAYLREYEVRHGAVGLREFPYPTSAENLAFYIFDQLTLILKTRRDVRLHSLKLQETDSATIFYALGDYKLDLQLHAKGTLGQ